MDWKNRIIRYGTQPADQFLANPRNPRKHPQRQRDALTGSLNTLGWIAPVIVNVRTGYMIDGHERVWQALENNNADVPFVEIDLDEAEETQALLTFDFITAMAEYDRENLEALLREVNTDEAALQAAIAELASSAGLYTDTLVEAVPDAQLDRAEELREQWQTERGQLWCIPSAHGGEHRLLCADSLTVSSAEILHDELEKYVLFCDPFFQDDVIQRVNDLYSFDTASFITGGKQLKEILLKVKRFHEGVILGLAVHPQMGNWNALMSQHKVCLWVSQVPMDFGIGFSSVLQSAEGSTRKVGDVYHHTSKPIDVCEALIRPHRQTVIIDPFAGSGSTLIACERLHRRWRGCEIEPSFVAAILERATLMGLVPQLVKQV